MLHGVYWFSIKSQIKVKCQVVIQHSHLLKWRSFNWMYIIMCTFSQNLENSHPHNKTFFKKWDSRFVFIHLSSNSLSCLLFNWVCNSVIIKWEGNEVSVSSTCHRYSLTLTWEGGGGSCASPHKAHNGNHNSINTFYIYNCAHRHTWAHRQRWKEWKRLFSKTLYWSCDFDSYTCCRTCEIKHEEHFMSDAN